MEIGVYLAVGIIWAVLLLGDVGPLGSWKERTTFWTANVLLWPLILILVVVCGVIAQIRKK